MKKLWQKRIVRVAVGMAVLLLAFAVQYRLTKIPAPPGEVGQHEKFAPATANLAQEVLVIEGLVVNAANDSLFEHEGKANEVVNVHFTGARLDALTVTNLSAPNFTPPADTNEISYTSPEIEDKAEPGQPCRTTFSVELKDGKPPAKLHLYQTGEAGAERRREIELKAVGAELVVRLFTAGPPADAPSGATPERKDCRKTLRIGDRAALPLYASTDMTAIAAPGSSIRFSFLPLDPKTELWDGDAEGLFAPLDFAPPKDETQPMPLRARAVSLRNHRNPNPDTPPLLRAESADAEMLRAYDLEVGSKKLQMKVSGLGTVSVNGQPVTGDFLERMQKQPMLAAVLAGLNAALLAWFVNLMRPKKDTTRAAE